MKNQDRRSNDKDTSGSGLAQVSLQQTLWVTENGLRFKVLAEQVSSEPG